MVKPESYGGEMWKRHHKKQKSTELGRLRIHPNKINGEISTYVTRSNKSDKFSI